MTIRYLTSVATAGLAGLVILLPAIATAHQGEDLAQTSSEAELAKQGGVLFAQRCAGCHSAEPGQPSYGGPNLAGVVGRPAASAQFRYSAALRSSGLTWSVQELDAYLASPMTKVPGTSMVISLSDAGQRAAVTAFLAAKGATE